MAREEMLKRIEEALGQSSHEGTVFANAKPPFVEGISKDQVQWLVDRLNEAWGLSKEVEAEVETESEPEPEPKPQPEYPHPGYRASREVKKKKR